VRSGSTLTSKDSRAKLFLKGPTESFARDPGSIQPGTDWKGTNLRGMPVIVVNRVHSGWQTGGCRLKRLPQCSGFTRDIEASLFSRNDALKHGPSLAEFFGSAPGLAGGGHSMRGHTPKEACRVMSPGGRTGRRWNWL